MKAVGIVKKKLLSHKILLLVFLILGIITSASTVLIPRVTGVFIDSLINNIDLDTLIRFCILFGTITLISIVAGYFNNRLYVKLNANIVFDLKKSIISEFRHSDIMGIKKLSIPEIAQMSNRDLEFIISNALTVLQSIIINTLLVVSSVLILLRINKYVALLLSFITIAYVILFISFKSMIVSVNKEFLSEQTRYFKKYFEQFGDIEFIKNNVLNKFYDNFLFNSYKKFFLSSMKMQKINYSFNSIDKFCMTVAQIILFFIGGREVIRANITVGDFTVLSTYFSLALTSIRYFLNLGKLKKEIDVSLDRIDSILNLKKDDDGHIELNLIDDLELNLSQEPFFKSSSIALGNIKFIKGKIYMITGANGSGKTTFMNILSGLYKFPQIEYRINNINVKKIDMEFNRKNRFAILEQFPRLVEGTVKENVVLGIDPQILTEVNIDYLSELFKLKGLYERVIENEFINLSGGEIKKISIVRTLLKKSEVILMDEPTVNLDKEAKASLIDYLVKSKNDKIIIITSHDTELIEISDEVINI